MRKPPRHAAITAITAIVLAAALSLAGCAAAAGSSSSSAAGGSRAGSGSSVSSPEKLAPGVAIARGGSVLPGDTIGTTAGTSGSAASVDRSVVVTGTVTVTAGDPVAAASRAVTIVESAGGRIDGRTENAASNGDRGSATLVLRIPAAKLTPTLDALKKLGRADRVQIDSTDVTTQSQDLDARVTALRATISRLLQLESTATDTTNLIAIETAIGDRQGELESLEAQQRGLVDQVSMSTITLDLRSDAAAPPIKPADFWSGLGAGWKAFVAFWLGALVAFGVALPWLLLIGIGAAIVLVAVRIARRRAGHPATASITPAAMSAATSAGTPAATPAATPTPPTSPIG